MSTINGKHYSTFQLFKIFFIQRSRSYRKERHIRKCDMNDIVYRLISVMADLVVMLSPMYLWVVMLLLVCGDVLPVGVMVFGHIFIIALLFGTCCFVQPYLSTLTFGQSLGRYLCKFKVTKWNGDEAEGKTLFLREVICTFPALLLLVIFGFLPLLVYLLLNLLVMIADPMHRCIADFFTKTRTVVLLNTPKRVVSVKQEEVKEPAKEVMQGTIDLHLYSDFSYNGQYTVEELFQMAKKRGVKCISITDRNSAKANGIAEQMSTLYGIQYVPGIEIDCIYQGKEVSLLGYHIDYRKEAFKKIENDYLSIEREVSEQRIQKFEAYTGMKIYVDQMKLNRFQIITPKMIAKQVFTNPNYKQSELLHPYLYGEYKQDPYYYFERDFFANGKPCHVERRLPDMRVIAEVIRRSGGVSILAQPMWQFDNDLELIAKALHAGVDGLEVFSSTHDAKQIARLMKLAKDEHCLIASGSGFAGEYRPNIQIGETNCPVAAEPVLKKLLNKHQ